MPINMFKYALGLISISIITYFCIRLIATKLKKAGILKSLKFGKNKAENPQEKKDEKIEWPELNK